MNIASFMEKQEEILAYEKELQIRIKLAEDTMQRASEKERMANIMLFGSCVLIICLIGIACQLRFA